MMKGLFLLAWAMFIDGLQAGISFALAGFMGTIGGSVAGAVTAMKVCPTFMASICATGGATAAGILGTGANAALAPIGILLGFVINICISLTMGAGLILALVIVFGRPSAWLWGGFIGDMIPGVNNLPFWTLMVIRAWWEHAQAEGKTGLVDSAAAMFLSPARAIMGMKEDTAALPGVQKTFGALGARQERPLQPQTGESPTKLARTRAPMQDIRPAQKPNVQPA